MGSLGFAINGREIQLNKGYEGEALNFGRDGFRI